MDKQYTVNVPTSGWVSENIEPWGNGRITMGLPTATATAEPAYNKESDLKVALVKAKNGERETGLTINGVKVFVAEFFLENRETGEQKPAPADIASRVKFI